MENSLPVFALFSLGLVGCSSSSSVAAAPEDAGGDVAVVQQGDSGSPPALAAVVLSIGTLASSDLAVAQGVHDGSAGTVEPQAKGAGDVGHTIMLGTSILGTHKNEFLSLDRWKDTTHLDGFYANPDFKAALASLLSTSTFDVYVPAEGWKAWGTLDSANDADPHYWIVVRGTLKSADTATNRAAHDAVAVQFEGPAKQAGDVGHIVFIGRSDPRQFFAVDVWRDGTNIESFYGKPEVAGALAPVFEGPPTLGIYQSTKWHQW
jgi:hypothetical protein